jgi:hypothetical protein
MLRQQPSVIIKLAYIHTYMHYLNKKSKKHATKQITVQHNSNQLFWITQIILSFIF